MTSYLILCLAFFILGFVSCALNFKFWLRKKQLTKFQAKRIATLIQDKYLRTEDKVQKIMEIIKS